MRRLKERSTGEVFTADDYNALAAAANMLFAAAGGRGTRVTIGPSGLTIAAPSGAKIIQEPAQVAWAVNIGSEDLGVFDVCQITKPHFVQDPVLNDGQPLDEPDYWTKRLFEVLVPEDNYFGRFGVCAEHIPAGRVGRIWISGACLCRISPVNRAMNYQYGWTYFDRADTRAGETYLEANPLGAAQILWLDRAAYESPLKSYPGVIRFDSRRTSGAYVASRGDFSRAGVAEVIALDSSVRVFPSKPGLVTITKA